MLAKKNRLPRSAWPSGAPMTRVRSAYGTVSYHRAHDDSVVRVAVVVSKKVAKHAVRRNRLRRSVYDVAGTVLPTLSPGHYVIRLQKAASTTPLQTLRTEVQTLLQEIIGRIEKAR